MRGRKLFQALLRKKDGGTVPPAEGCGMDYAHLTHQELHRLTRRRLRQGPTDLIAWQANIDDFRALAIEINARMEQAPAGTKNAQVI